MKKIISFIVLLVCLFVLAGCNKSLGFENLEREEIYTKTDGNYFVFFYQDNCDDCEKTLPIIKSYNQLLKDEADKYEGKNVVYGVNLSDKANSSMLRAYKGSNGQGKDGDFWVNDVDNWEDLYIGGTAALISIGTDNNGNRIAEFEAEGYDDILARLNRHLGIDTTTQNQ